MGLTVVGTKDVAVDVVPVVLVAVMVSSVEYVVAVETVVSYVEIDVVVLHSVSVTGYL